MRGSSSQIPNLESQIAEAPHPNPLPRVQGRGGKRGAAVGVALAIVFAATSLPATRAFADPPTPPWLGGPVNTHFDQGSWTFQSYAGYLNDLGSQDTEGGFGTIGVGYHVWDNVSLSAEFSGYFFAQPGDHDASAVGGGVTLRHHLFNHGRSSYFVDVAFSAVQASEPVPEDGTSFNFITQTGVGVAHGLSGGTHLLLGVRFTHLSNADREGDARNPALNGISAYAGVMFAF